MLFKKYFICGDIIGFTVSSPKDTTLKLEGKFCCYIDTYSAQNHLIASCSTATYLTLQDGKKYLSL